MLLAQQGSSPFAQLIAPQFVDLASHNCVSHCASLEGIGQADQNVPAITTENPLNFMKTPTSCLKSENISEDNFLWQGNMSSSISWLKKECQQISKEATDQNLLELSLISVASFGNISEAFGQYVLPTPHDSVPLDSFEAFPDNCTLPNSESMLALANVFRSEDMFGSGQWSF